MNRVEFVRRHNVSPVTVAMEREIFLPLEYYAPRVYKNQCRYRKLRRLQDKEKKRLYHESYNRITVDLSSTDSYYTVTTETENRLDMISSIYYNTPRFWWVIATANNIIDPFDVPVNTYLRIPNTLSLYNKGGILSDD